MFHIDPHIHMISRVMDDYHRMAQCGFVAVSEPEFWAGFVRFAQEQHLDLDLLSPPKRPKRP